MRPQNRPASKQQAGRRTPRRGPEHAGLQKNRAGAPRCRNLIFYVVSKLPCGTKLVFVCCLVPRVQSGSKSVPWRLPGRFWAAPGRLGAPRHSCGSIETKFVSALEDPKARFQNEVALELRHPPHENLFFLEHRYKVFDPLHDPRERFQNELALFEQTNLGLSLIHI